MLAALAALVNDFFRREFALLDCSNRFSQLFAGEPTDFAGYFFFPMKCERHGSD